MSSEVQFHQPLEPRQQRQITAAPGLDYCLHDLANTGLVQHSIDETQAVKLLALTPDLFCRFHMGLILIDLCH
jgi:hypothetical protein